MKKDRVQAISGPVIGVDEAGRGPVFGPLVAAGVYIEEQGALQALGVRDSKVLSPGRREELFRKIKEVCRFETVILRAKDIDTLREALSLNLIEAEVFATVINRLLSSSILNAGETLHIIMDAADVREAVFGEQVKERLGIKPGTGIQPIIISRHRADSIYPAVSAASIVAKVTRDREIEKIRKVYGEVGSGYPADPVTRAYLLNLVKNGQSLPDFVRRSWKTVKRLKKEAAVKRLNDF